jgi:hypothetical protein
MQSEISQTSSDMTVLFYVDTNYTQTELVIIGSMEEFYLEIQKHYQEQ